MNEWMELLVISTYGFWLHLPGFTKQAWFCCFKRCLSLFAECVDTQSVSFVVSAASVPSVPYCKSKRGHGLCILHKAPLVVIFDSSWFWMEWNLMHGRKRILDRSQLWMKGAMNGNSDRKSVVILPEAAKYRRDSHFCYLYHSCKYLQTYYQTALSPRGPDLPLIIGMCLSIRLTYSGGAWVA